jgi:hypothetical protein
MQKVFVFDKIKSVLSQLLKISGFFKTLSGILSFIICFNFIFYEQNLTYGKLNSFLKTTWSTRIVQGSKGGFLDRRSMVSTAYLSGLEEMLGHYP